ncbi:MAG TPA: hypothetical protein VGN17_27805 [Bryobacteraceae bacterium]|jgi:hypothetical protein
MSEDRVVEALRALRDADAHVEASPELEVRLMRAARSRRRRAPRIWIGGGLVATLAASAALVLLLHARRAEPMPVKSASPVIAAAPAPPPPEIAPVVSKPKPKPVRRQPRAPREVTTEFYPLVQVAQPFERTELMRVTVPASTMRDVGLFVNATHLDDPVQADVLIDQQGLAIRFVSYQY